LLLSEVQTKPNRKSSEAKKRTRKGVGKFFPPKSSVCSGSKKQNKTKIRTTHPSLARPSSHSMKGKELKFLPAQIAGLSTILFHPDGEYEESTQKKNVK
jgi:hypothetical protein